MDPISQIKDFFGQVYSTPRVDWCIYIFSQNQLRVNEKIRQKNNHLKLKFGEKIGGKLKNDNPT